MSNLSSLLMGDISLKNKTQGSGTNQNNSEENFDNKNDSLNASSENVKIKVVNMQEYKTKKYLQERKNMKVWDNSGNKKEKKGKKEKKEVNLNGNISETKKDNKTEKTLAEETKTEKKLYRPPIKTILAKEKEKEKLAAENEEEDMFPDLMKAKNVDKANKKKNQPVKKSKKDKKKKTEEEKEKEVQKKEEDERKSVEGEHELKKVEKINFNIFDIIDIKRQYEPISRNIEKVAQKYENRQKYKELVECS